MILIHVGVRRQLLEDVVVEVVGDVVSFVLMPEDGFRDLGLSLHHLLAHRDDVDPVQLDFVHQSVYVILDRIRIQVRTGLRSTGFMYSPLRGTIRRVRRVEVVLMRRLQ